ncbi:LmbE family N-acetylglucosaminyl deacetylase [Pseudomonas sp. OV226]|jgi:LmbE family N-acetylglucosaminyl deacetylase|nr:LmbE family N-acetylglucosaminyl deacetylase [Pseudomonas sp. OV226]
MKPSRDEQRDLSNTLLPTIQGTERCTIVIKQNKDVGPMKPVCIIDSSQPAQIWNSALQLDNIPVINTQTLVPTGARAVVIAPHPGDEVVFCGGLLQLLSTLEHPLQLISITDGSAPHPGSQQWSEKRLSVFRGQESVEALRRLGLPLHSLKWIRGGFTDNALAEHETQLTQFIARYLRAGDVVFSTWREDGMSDHNAVGRACALAASQVGATFHEMPVWAWHWPARDHGLMPWHRARKVRLDTWTVARKSHATHAYASQLDGEPALGIAPLLPRVILDRIRMPYEIVFI